MTDFSVESCLETPQCLEEAPSVTDVSLSPGETQSSEGSEQEKEEPVWLAIWSPFYVLFSRLGILEMSSY